jgi:hypothetical protein
VTHASRTWASPLSRALVFDAAIQARRRLARTPGSEEAQFGHLAVLRTNDMLITDSIRTNVEQPGWLAERRGRPEDSVVPTSRGRPLSRDAVALLVTNHAITARQRCPSIDAKTITPHVLRHSTAMTL